MTAGFVVGGIGAGFGVASFTCMGLGAAKSSSIKNGGFASASDISAADSTGKTYNTVATATGIIGAIGVVIGVPLILLNLPETESPPARAASLSLTPTLGGLSLSGGF